MANLADIVSRKQSRDEEWKAQRQADRDNAVAMQDTAVSQIAQSPEAYAAYLDCQGDNLMYSVGNIALALFQQPEVTKCGTAERWKSLGRTVLQSEKPKGFQIFARSSFGKGYQLTDAYDISQTQGRELTNTGIQNGSKEMEQAMETVLNYSAVPVVIDENMDVPAFYDQENLELAVNPRYPDNEAFSAIATEVAHSRFHNKGRNPFYNREESELDAQSVSYILCKRYEVKREMPDLSNLEQLYDGWSSEEVRRALDSVQGLCKQMGNSIDRNLEPKQHTRGTQARRPSR